MQRGGLAGGGRFGSNDLVAPLESLERSKDRIGNEKRREKERINSKQFWKTTVL